MTSHQHKKIQKKLIEEQKETKTFWETMGLPIILLVLAFGALTFINDSVGMATVTGGVITEGSLPPTNTLTTVINAEFFIFAVLLFTVFFMLKRRSE